MKTSFTDILVATGGSLLFLLLSVLYARAVRAGQPLLGTQGKIIWYGFFLVLGIAYLIMFGGNLDWPPETILTLIGVWGVVVTLVAWWRFKRVSGRGTSPGKGTGL